MSTVLRPSGPHTWRTYWIRRTLFFVVLALAVWGVARWLGVQMPGSDQDGDAASPVATAPDPTASASPRDRDREPQSPPGVTPGVRLVPVRFLEPTQDCAPSSVRVLPAVTDPVPAGEAVRVQLRIATTAESACTVDLDSASLLVAVSSGEEPVWSSTQCTSAVPTRTLVAQPHWSTVVEVAWSGQLTRNRCSLTAPWAPPGVYTVQAALLEGEPATADFELAAPESTQAAPKRDKPREDDKERPQT
ncbi:MAG: hypothetical protein ACR2JT_04820 [Nocardioidaceae bacterium]